MVVHTPRLCSEPLFLASGDSSDSEEIQKITCDPIASPAPALQIVAAARPPPTVSDLPQVELEVSKAEEQPVQQQQEEETAPTIFEPNDMEIQMVYIDQKTNKEVTDPDDTLVKQGQELLQAIKDQLAVHTVAGKPTEKKLIDQIVEKIMGSKGGLVRDRKARGERPYIGSSAQQTLKGIYGQVFVEEQEEQKRDEL
jgi:hypothetical protein